MHPQTEKIFKNHAFTALKNRFCNDRDEFKKFYDSLDSSIQDDFLDAAAFYLFLVKQGDWHVKVEGRNPIDASINDSIKLVSLFGLIESLSDEENQDFYKWLYVKNKESKLFPICDKKTLSELYNDYKKVYGSIRCCVAFFERLPEDNQKRLLETIKIKPKCQWEYIKSAEEVKDILNKGYNKGRPFPYTIEVVNESGGGETITSFEQLSNFYERLQCQDKMFDNLEVRKRLEVEARPMGSIKEMAQFLYNLRSKFVHKLRLSNLGGPDRTAIEIDDKTLFISNLGIADLQTLFEEGLLAHFSELNKTKKMQA